MIGVGRRSGTRLAISLVLIFLVRQKDPYVSEQRILPTNIAGNSIPAIEIRIPIQANCKEAKRVAKTAESISADCYNIRLRAVP